MDKPPVAQKAEQPDFKPEGSGSIPDGGSTCMVISKRVPINGIKTMFMYGFDTKGLSKLDIERNRIECQDRIDADIKEVLGMQ